MLLRVQNGNYAERREQGAEQEEVEEEEEERLGSPD